MKDDPIPTFRRAGRGLVRFVRSRKLWRAVLIVEVAAAILAVLGWPAASLSRIACENDTRREMASYTGLARLPVDWLDATSLVPFRFPRDWVHWSVYAREARSVFRPSYLYRSIDQAMELPDGHRARSWAYVEPRVEQPFVVRVHFGFGASWPYKRVREDGTIDWSWRGRSIDGVNTYVGAFGFAVPIDRWSVGW